LVCDPAAILSARNSSFFHCQLRLLCKPQRGGDRCHRTMFLVPIQGLSGETHSCQSHRSLRALANLSRFKIPRPPFSFGRLHLVLETLHFPPVSKESPVQRNFFRVLSSSARTSWDAFGTVNRTRQFLPACVRCRPCQPDTPVVALSTRG